MPAAVPTRLSGLALPALKSTGGCFSDKGTEDVAWGDLILAAFVPFGGRFMRRSLGSAFPALLMDPVDSVIQAEAGARIRDAVQRQCPHVRVTSVQVKPSKTAAGDRGIDVQIGFTVVGESDGQTRLVRLDRSAVMNNLRAIGASRYGA